MSQALRDKEGNYIFGGRKYRSVTTIIHEEYPHSELETWKEKTPNWPEYTRKARIYGIMMHVQLQSTIADIPVDLPCELPYWEWPEDLEEELIGRMEQWKKLELKLEKPNLIEHTVKIESFDNSGKLEVASAGTWDYWGAVDGVKEILDWKSSKRPYKAHRIQMGAYYLGATQEGIEVEMAVIPYIRRNSAELVELSIEELKEEGENFLELARKSYEKLNGKDL